MTAISATTTVSAVRGRPQPRGRTRGTVKLPLGLGRGRTRADLVWRRRSSRLTLDLSQGCPLNARHAQGCRAGRRLSVGQRPRRLWGLAHLRPYPKANARTLAARLSGPLQECEDLAADLGD